MLWRARAIGPPGTSAASHEQLRVTTTGVSFLPHHPQGRDDGLDVT